MSLGIGFWRRCFASPRLQVEPIPFADVNCVGLGSSFFLSSEVDSWHQRCISWSTGGLTRTLLSTHSSKESVDSNLSLSVTLDAGPSQRSAYSSSCTFISPTSWPSPSADCSGNDGYRRFADDFVCRGIDGCRRCAVGSDEWVAHASDSDGGFFEFWSALEITLASASQRGADGNGPLPLVLEPQDLAEALSVRSCSHFPRETLGILPIRGYLEGIKKLMKGDMYIGRGSSLRGLSRSICCNTFKVSKLGSFVMFCKTIQGCARLSGHWLEPGLYATVSCGRIVTVTSLSRNTPQCIRMHSMARLREEPDSGSGSSADEGWSGSGNPMMIGSGFTTRDICDGQSLASPGRWPPHARKYPSSSMALQHRIAIDRSPGLSFS